MNSKIKNAFYATIPVMAGYLVLGIGFGMVLRTRGYGILWALAMSVFIYAGSMQYVAIDLLTGGVSLITAAVTTLAVNARHLFYSISMIDKYKNQKRKNFLIFTLTDETYSLVCSEVPDGTDASSYYFYVSLFDYIYWIGGSAIGSVLGSVLPIRTEGVDFALTALFLTVFVEQWLTTKNHLSAIIGVGASVICLLLFGSDKFLIPAMILITCLLLAMKNKEGITNE